MNVRYTVTPRPTAHKFDVVLDIVEPSPDGQVIALPAWIRAVHDSGLRQARGHARGRVGR